MYSRLADELATFAGEDPGTWSLLVGLALGVAAFAGVVLAVFVVEAWNGTTVSGRAVEFLLAATAVGLGTGVGTWYLAVERAGRSSIRRGATAGLVTGLFAGPLAWVLVDGWQVATSQATGRPAVQDIASGYSRVLFSPDVSWTVASTVPLCVIVTVVAVRLRQSIRREATDAAVAARLEREP